MLRNLIKERIEIYTGIKNVRVEFPSDISKGDYSTNVALTNKLDANELAIKLNSDENLKKFFEKVENLNGFLNFYVNKNYLLEFLNKNADVPKENSSKKVIIEYSSPNIAKSFSVGHFRSTIIGQAIYNIYKDLGYSVKGINHIGDWGTQFGMILAEIELNNTSLEDISLSELEEMYINFNSKLKENESLKEKARNWFKRLEEEDSEAVSKWQRIREISLKEFEKTYDQLGVHIDEIRGESFYSLGEAKGYMQDIISQAKEKGISSAGEGGAIIVEFENMPPAMLVKSNGTTTYFTRDLAAIKYRVEVDKADLIIYEVGAEQTLHFRQVFAAAKNFDWGKNVELMHVPHGLIRLASGKMSTREGNVIKLKDLLEKAIQKAESQVIGIGALKYNDLKRNPTGEIVFDWDEVLSQEGNSGPYLQYTVVRGKSVLEKFNMSLRVENRQSNLEFEVDHFKSLVMTDTESNLLRKLSRFNDVIIDAANNYSPSVIATYIYDLAQSFNSFYNSSKIVGSENEDFKLALTSKTVEVVEKGLGLLGIEVPDKM